MPPAIRTLPSGRRVALCPDRGRLQRRSSIQRTCDGGCRCGNSRGISSERPSGDGETDDHRDDKKFAERFMWVLLEDQTPKNDSREQDDSLECRAALRAHQFFLLARL